MHFQSNSCPRHSCGGYWERFNCWHTPRASLLWKLWETRQISCTSLCFSRSCTMVLWVTFCYQDWPTDGKQQWSQLNAGYPIYGTTSCWFLPHWDLVSKPMMMEEAHSTCALGTWWLLRQMWSPGPAHYSTGVCWHAEGLIPHQDALVW